MKTVNCPHCNKLIEVTGLISDIKEFHEKFGLHYNDGPRELPDGLQRFRIGFLQEELFEYESAVANGDREKMLDGLVDLVYVALGTAYLHGFCFHEAWKRVHQANMAKIRVERAEDSTRQSSFDVIKPQGWQAPDLKDLV